MKNYISKDYIPENIAKPVMQPDNSSALTADPQIWVPVPPANINHPVREFASEVSLPADRESVRHAWYRGAGKRVVDVLFVLATLPISLPIVFFCAIALWIEGGSPFYRQDRLGKGGRRFSILKLRTMVRDADDLLAHYLENDPVLREEWETTQKLKNDPRITRTGAFLRATSLDELPQLWNVLKGEMSMVGPRPMMPEQLSLYGNPKAYFALQPGITGIWQVSARNETRFSYRAEVDAQYFRELSLLVDLGLVLKTVGVVLRRTGY